MKKVIYLIALVFAISDSKAQSTINAAGFTATHNNIVHDISIGEMCIVNTVFNPKYIFTNGLLQPSDSPEKFNNTQLSILCYPNPTTDGFWIDIQQPMQGEVVIAILDAKGAVVHQQNNLCSLNSNAKIYIDASKLPSGTYIVSVECKASQQLKFQTKLQKL